MRISGQKWIQYARTVLQATQKSHENGFHSVKSEKNGFPVQVVGFEPEHSILHDGQHETLSLECSYRD